MMGTRMRHAARVLVLATIASSMLGMTSAEEVRTRRGVVYLQTEDGNLSLDIYRKRNSSRLPVLILVHGGSWRSGYRTDWNEIAPEFAKAGFLVVVPDYRLSAPGGDAVFPQHVSDLKEALLWTRLNAHGYGGVGRRIGMVGTSAGAHLTLLKASTGKARPEAIALYSAPADLARLHEDGIAQGAIESFIGCLPIECPDAYSAASGIEAADRATPPVLLAYSKHEILPLGHSRTLKATLRGLGVKTQVHELPGQLHGLGVARKMIDETIVFMARQLKSP